MKSASDVIYVTDVSFLHGSTEFDAFYFISHKLDNKSKFWILDPSLCFTFVRKSYQCLS